MVNEVVDLDLYVGTQKVKLFGNEHELKRLTNREYFEMNNLDIQFQNAMSSIGPEAAKEVIQKMKEAEAKQKGKKRTKTKNVEAPITEKDVEKLVFTKMDKVLEDRELAIQKFIKKVIPTLTDEEIQQSTLNLFNAIKREIEVRLWMDKNYTREESLQRVKDAEERSFREATIQREVHNQTEPPAG